MAHIQRLYDFQPGTKILSNQVDAEFNQLINYVNGLDDANSALASETGATKVGVSEGGNLQELLDRLVRFATDNIKYIRLNENKIIETSPDGVNWEAIGSSGGSGGSGHLIQRANGTILPQRSRLQFTNTTILDDPANDRTVVQGIQGPQGPQGPVGPQGPPGPGLPPGGTLGQIPVKISDTDYDIIWATPNVSGGGKVARFTIGTSTAGWAEEDCDYLCDGTDDQVEIIQALNDLPETGGEVVILDGIYDITASINIPKDNVSLRGNGNATILKRMYDSTDTDSGATAKGLITLNEKSGCKVQNMQIDGNKATYTASYNYGIYLFSSSDNTVAGNTCNNNRKHGIFLTSSSNNTVAGNTCNNNSDDGIFLYLDSINNTVIGNTCNNNFEGIALSGSSDNNTITGNICSNNRVGIDLSSSSSNAVTGNTCNNNDYYGIWIHLSHNTVAGNTCNNNNNGIHLTYSGDNTIIGNNCNSNSNCGIYVRDASINNTVTGNTCNDNGTGIYLSSASNNNTVTGNTCIRGTGIPESYLSSHYTIRISDSNNNYNIIYSNNCMGKAPVVEGGIGNSVWGNKFDDTDDLPVGSGDMMQAVYDPDGDGIVKAADVAYSVDWANVQGQPKVNGKALSSDITLTATDVGAIPVSLKGVAYGVAELDETGKVPSSQLPSYGGANSTDTVYARFVVGTSTADWTEEDCDYLCDGTDDQEEIIAALTALPTTGGEVVILDGTYNITASINVPENNVSIRGIGNATILKRMYDSTSANSGPTASGLITLNGKSGCKIQGLQIDGNKETYTGDANYGIYLSLSNNNTITGNTCNNNQYGIDLYASNNNTITGNTCNNNDYVGISIDATSSDNTITDNTCNNNVCGIDLFLSSNNTVTGNTCDNNSSYGISLYSSSNYNTVTGNTCDNNNYGIYLFSSSNNTVTSNTCNNNNYGIYLNSSSDNNTVTGNTCNNNSNYGIYLSSSSDNTVTDNTCNNNDYGIFLSSSSDNTITGNTCNNNNYGIYLYSSSSDNTVTGNTCNNNDYVGFCLESSSNNTITGNTCNNNSIGIGLFLSSNNTVTGNTCIRGIGTPEDYTEDQYTIFLYGTDNNYNLISSNNCMGKAVVVEGGTGNSAWGNKFDSTDDFP